MAQLDIQELKTVIKVLHPEIISAPAFVNLDSLKSLGINVLTGIQFKDSIIKHVRKGGTGRGYKPGVTVQAGDLGALVERELTTKLSKGLYPDNIQLYREVEPFENIMADINAAKNTRVQVEAISKQFAEDLYANLFLGKWDPNANNSLGMMDGICTILQRHINAGEIAQELGNLVPLSATIDSSTDADDAWEIVKDWCSKWSTKLKAARNTTGVIVYLTQEVFDLMVDGYLQTYPHRQMDDVEADGYEFMTLRGIKFRPTALLGHGARMIATVPGNFDFGLDSENDASSVKITENPTDPNYIYFHVQAAAGTRVRFIESDSLCINDQSSVADETILGDFQKASLIATSNDTTKGTVSSSVEDLTDLAAGTAVTLTASPKSGYVFSKWSDDVTVNPRVIITNGTPRAYQAIFVAE